MKHKVIRKQKNSKLCFLCGLKNPFGLKGFFYELNNNELVCVAVPKEEHQSYPGRLHGGIATAMLDETIGRAILMNNQEEVWGITIEFTTKFKKPIPLNQELRIVGRITSETSRVFEGTGEILLPDNTVAAEGFGRYLKMPLSKISDFDPEIQEWKITHLPEDPSELDV
jgi:acyl-coenzyme A thioesterase PaaI-like protein